MIWVSVEKRKNYSDHFAVKLKIGSGTFTAGSYYTKERVVDLMNEIASAQGEEKN